MDEFWWNDSLAYSARTDVGMRRSNNQDSFCVSPASSPRLWQSRGHVFIVADGMGAHAAGELASKMAVDSVLQAYLKRTDQTPPDALRDAILDAHAAIKKHGDEHFEFKDMGTTCDALVLTPEGAYIGHVGDSRVYRLRDHVFEQMTFDHSLDWEVRFSTTGHSAYRNAAHIPKNIITRSLGPTDNLNAALEGPFELRPGDVFLMCSDGLSGPVKDAEMGQILSLFPPEEATETLVNLANLRGGPDNITVVVAKIKANPDVQALNLEYEKSQKVYNKRPPLSGLALTALVMAFVCLSLFIGSIVMLTNANDPSVEKTAKMVETILCGASGVLTLLGAGLFMILGKRTIFGDKKSRVDASAPLGKAPYIRSSAAPTVALADEFESLSAELCDVLKREPVFVPDWKGIDGAREQAKIARKEQKLAAALRANICVVNYIMRELRKAAERQRKGKGKK